MATDEAGTSPNSDHAARLAAVRSHMATQGIDALIVRGTDRYLNEYVPRNESGREWISGFTGSLGDVVVTADRAFVFVDGRYYIQAEQETDADLIEVVQVPLGDSNESTMYSRLKELAAQGRCKIGYEPDRFSVAEFTKMKKALLDPETDIELKPVEPSIVEQARGSISVRVGPLRAIDVAIAGRGVDAKLTEVRSSMAEHKLDALVFQALDDIAYLSNLRGNEITFQATFKAIAVVTSDDFAVAVPGERRGDGLKLPEGLRLIAEADWIDALPQRTTPIRVGYDKSTTTEATRAALQRAGAEPVPTSNPVAPVKNVKNDAELGHMIHAFRRADRAIWAAQTWLHDCIDAGQSVTEADFARQMAHQFEQSGALGLSFEVIAAAGPNAAIVHYTQPDDEKRIEPGTLILLDTGAHYEGGYATDLTRTFLAGRKGVEATERQRELFTIVLKSAIAGLVARFPQGTKGQQLDAICRSPIWAAGHQFLHGTGHGVGINVHEVPPRLSPIGAQPLAARQVFSVEPGIYLQDELGIRIENLATVISDPDVEGFLRVVPLTFSPLDDRLIDRSRLTGGELRFLEWFAMMGDVELDGVPEPPPLLTGSASVNC